MFNLFITILIFMGCNPNYGVSNKRAGAFSHRVKNIENSSINEGFFMPGQRAYVDIANSDFDPSDNISALSSKKGEEYFVYTEGHRIYVSPIIVNGSGKRVLSLIHDNNKIGEISLNVVEEFVTKEDIKISKWKGKANAGNTCYLNSLLHAIAPFVNLGYSKINFSDNDSKEHREKIITMNKVAQAIFNSIRLGGKGAISSYGEDGTDFVYLSRSFVKKVLERHFNNCSNILKIDGSQKDAEEFVNILLDLTMGTNAGMWKDMFFGSRTITSSNVEMESYRISSKKPFKPAWHANLHLVEGKDSDVQTLVNNLSKVNTMEINVVSKISSGDNEENIDQNNLTLSLTDTKYYEGQKLLQKEAKDIVKAIALAKETTLYLPDGTRVAGDNKNVKIDMNKVEEQNGAKPIGYFNSSHSLEAKTYNAEINEIYEMNKAPKVLMLRLVRFTNNNNRLSKMNNNIIINDEIEIDVTNGDISEKVKYKLKSYVNHFGSLTGGHYTSNVKDENGNWKYFDDSRVGEQVPHLNSKSSPYILFYEKVN